MMWNCVLNVKKTLATNYLQNYLDKIYLFMFVILLKNIAITGYHVDTHRLVKRMDLESCLGQFDVHRDTIIRTEESQAIGGKFIQGLALETLEECQRLCCETENCDVYIFEDKKEGYCYLFECGPPENFRCKFTRHANYTSAVLTPIRHVTQPPPPPPPPMPTLKSTSMIHSKSPVPGLSQHERELTNLKQKPDVVNLSAQNKMVTSTTTTVVAPIEMHMEEQQIATAKSSTGSNYSCKRFQFQCHSGECIAVYNACDGIPQCEDGSDEGPECPTTSVLSNKGAASKTDIIDRTSIPSHITSENLPIISKQSSVPSVTKQYQQQTPVQVPIMGNREDLMSAQSAMWANRKIQDLQPELERNSHIFNHKGGLQIATNNLGSQYANPNAGNTGLYSPIQRDIYMPSDIQNAYRNVLLQPKDHMIAPPGLNWQNQQQQQQQMPPQIQSIIPGNSYVISVNGEPVPHVQQIPQLPPIPQTLNNNNNNNYDELHPVTPKTQEVPIVPLPSSISNPKNDKLGKDHEKGEKNHKGNSEESEEYSDYAEKSTEPPKKKQRKHKKVLPSKDANNKSKTEKTETERVHDMPIHQQYKILKEDLEMEFVDHDGQSERPGGAVLSLTLGIIVTAALAVLVGCRMRTVSRRVRRMGKAPYAHDADFLVNGMYL